ncbi:aldehyde dehydrogenase (NADP(+)) [Rhodobacter capsulatus]|uniref:aldehyde dehydrogenase (NADP(+)) n=1 Tax=Rhodobacter capsulatus TaxID=1061 RepID=UPI004026EBEB
MTYTPHGRHLIAGDWLSSAASFTSDPATGPAQIFGAAGADLVESACRAAETAFESYGQTPVAIRAAFLEAIAEEIEARAEAITEIGTRETGLPVARLQGERGRTTGQLRLFAEHIRAGGHLDLRHDPALPDRAPLPRPDLRLIQRPIGPVAVFGASNFPLAFSTAGGDTAAALAAGCPVVVKGHPAHPGTGEIMAEAIHAAVLRCGLPGGTFSFLQGPGADLGASLVCHPAIRAVGFTGSLAAGRALFDLCAARPEPIPFFGELGAINPMFLLPAAISARGAAIASGWAGSLTMGVGQFCTNPGLVVIRADQAEAFTAAARKALSEIAPQTMLTAPMAAAFRAGCDRVALTPGVTEALRIPCADRQAAPALFRVSAGDWQTHPGLSHEVFGPMGLIVEAETEAEMVQIAQTLAGQLTATLHLEDADLPLARRLLPVLERKAGRVLVNGFPTGVEVADAMVHGGPYPASTNFGATSVGTLSIRRFLRPVCYQNLPEGLLPEDLR